MDGLDFPSADTNLQYKTSQDEHVPLHKMKWYLLIIDHIYSLHLIQSCDVP